MAKIYKEVEYGKLLEAQDKICEQLLSEIFGVEQTLDEASFKSKLSGYKFLDSLESIRNVIFDRANVERKYINEDE